MANTPSPTLTVEQLKAELDQVSARMGTLEVRSRSTQSLEHRRWVSYFVLFVFAAITLLWLVTISLCPRFRPCSWLGLATSLIPAVMWLGAAELAFRWLRSIR